MYFLMANVPSISFYSDTIAIWITLTYYYDMENPKSLTLVEMLWDTKFIHKYKCTSCDALLYLHIYLNTPTLIYPIVFYSLFCKSLILFIRSKRLCNLKVPSCHLFSIGMLTGFHFDAVLVKQRVPHVHEKNERA